MGFPKKQQNFQLASVFKYWPQNRSNQNRWALRHDDPELAEKPEPNYMSNVFVKKYHSLASEFQTLETHFTQSTPHLTDSNHPPHSLYSSTIQTQHIHSNHSLNSLYSLSTHTLRFCISNYTRLLYPLNSFTYLTLLTLHTHVMVLHFRLYTSCIAGRFAKINYKPLRKTEDKEQ